MSRMLCCCLLLGIAAACGIGQLTSRAQAPEVPSAAIINGRFQFEVVESFDAKYLGDTPGFIGRNGGLAEARPNIALGDSVYRGETKIGAVTGIIWERLKGSLTIEFDPEPRTRIGVGETVWLALDSRTDAEKGNGKPR